MNKIMIINTETGQKFAISEWNGPIEFDIQSDGWEKYISEKQTHTIYGKFSKETQNGRAWRAFKGLCRIYKRRG